MSVNITNPPLDRRRLSREDRSAYNQSGSHAEARKAVARTRAYRGKQKYESNRPTRAQDRPPGSGGFMGGVAIQQARMRQLGQEQARAKALRPAMPDSQKENIYQV